MSARTVKGPMFAIVVDGKRITVKHIYSKGKRCRVVAPAGVVIEVLKEKRGPLGGATEPKTPSQSAQSSNPPKSL